MGLASTPFTGTTLPVCQVNKGLHGVTATSEVPSQTTTLRTAHHAGGAEALTPSLHFVTQDLDCHSLRQRWTPAPGEPIRSSLP